MKEVFWYWWDRIFMRCCWRTTYKLLYGGGKNEWTFRSFCIKCLTKGYPYSYMYEPYIEYQHQPLRKKKKFKEIWINI